MTGIELEALRRLLFFSRPEAAALLGQVEDRSWNKWETGQRAVPADVADRMVQLSAWRQMAVQAMLGAIQEARDAQGEPESIALVWYTSADDWATLPGREPWLWRPHCSALAQVAAVEPLVSLTPFDPRAYAVWLAGRPDSETSRSEWAAFV